MLRLSFACGVAHAASAATQSEGTALLHTRDFRRQLGDMFRMTGCPGQMQLAEDQRHRGGNLSLIHIPRTGGTTVEECSANEMLEERRWGKYRSVDMLQKDPAFNCSIWHAPPKLLDHNGSPHCHVLDHSGDGGYRPYAEDEESFCVVRNPYERLISEYGFFVAHWIHDQEWTDAGVNQYAKYNIKENEPASKGSKITGAQVRTWKEMGLDLNTLVKQGVLKNGDGCKKDHINAGLLRKLNLGKGVKHKDTVQLLNGKMREINDDCHYLPQAAYVWSWDVELNRLDKSKKCCKHVLSFENLVQDFNTFMSDYGYPYRMQHEVASTLTASSDECHNFSPSDLSDEVVHLIEEKYAADFDIFPYERLSEWRARARFS